MSEDVFQRIAVDRLVEHDRHQHGQVKLRQVQDLTSHFRQGANRMGVGGARLRPREDDLSPFLTADFLDRVASMMAAG